MAYQPINPISISLEFPSNNDTATLKFLRYPAQILSIESIIRSGSNSSGFYVPWTLKYGTDRTTAGTEVIVGGADTTGTTFPTYHSTFTNSLLPSGNFLWLEIKSGISGAVNEFFATIEVV